MNTKNTVNWFFKKTLPAFKAEYSKYELNVKGIYIATCAFDEDAVSFMSGLMTSKLRPTKMDTFYDKTKLLDLLKETKQTRIRDVINRYYS